MQPRCLVCHSLVVKPHFWPPARYEGREFRFYRCGQCRSLSIHPVPDQALLVRMYGRQPEHAGTESGGARLGVAELPTHRRLQVEFLASARRWFVGTRLLDYGCGDGFYMQRGLVLGLESVGVEFNKSYATALREKLSLPLVDSSTFLREYAGTHFDIIHLGHILEHLPEPDRLIRELAPFAHKGTLWLIDGPLEANFCLSRILVDLGSRVRRRPFQVLEPQHLIATTARSQRRFLEALGFQTLRFEIREHAWPLPDDPNWSNLEHSLRYLIAAASKILSSVVPGSGNLFHHSARLVTALAQGGRHSRSGTPR